MYDDHGGGGEVEGGIKEFGRGSKGGGDEVVVGDVDGCYLNRKNKRGEALSLALSFLVLQTELIGLRRRRRKVREKEREKRTTNRTSNETHLNRPPTSCLRILLVRLERVDETR